MRICRLGARCGFYDSAEGRAILSDRPSEYPYSFRRSRTGTVIEFKNEIGWSFAVRLDQDDDGEWLASKDGQHLSGGATGN